MLLEDGSADRYSAQDALFGNVEGSGHGDVGEVFEDRIGVLPEKLAMAEQDGVSGPAGDDVVEGAGKVEPWCTRHEGGGYARRCVCQVGDGLCGEHCAQLGTLGTTSPSRPEVAVPPEPDIVGALGAALIARDRHRTAA